MNDQRRRKKREVVHKHRRKREQQEQEKARKWEISDASTALGDWMLGYPLLGFPLLTIVRSAYGLLHKAGSFSSQEVIIGDRQSLLTNKIEEAKASRNLSHPNPLHSNLISLNQACDVPGMSDRDARLVITSAVEFGRLFDIDTPRCLDSDEKITDAMPENLSDFSISCASIFPLCLASLYSLQSTKRYSANFGLRNPALFGRDQIQYQLSDDQASSPSIIITANSPFFFLGRDYRNYSRYKLLTEIHHVQVYRIRKRKISQLFRKSKSLAFFSGTVAEQALRSTPFSGESIGYSSFEQFFSDPGRIDHDEMLVWEPLKSIMQAHGWEEIPGSKFSVPVSLFVNRDFLSRGRGGIDPSLKWLVRAFFNELDYLSERLGHPERILNEHARFNRAFELHSLKNS